MCMRTSYISRIQKGGKIDPIYIYIYFLYTYNVYRVNTAR